MTLKDLNDRQLHILKQRYLMEINLHTSWQQLEDADDIVSFNELYEFYKDQEFDEEEFNHIDERKSYSY